LDKSKSEETGENVQEDAYETWDIPSQLKTKFLELADEKGTIDWEGLKVLLELDTDHQIQFDKITCVLMVSHECDHITLVILIASDNNCLGPKRFSMKLLEERAELIWTSLRGSCKTL